MRIFVTMKQLGKRRDVLNRIPLELPGVPATLRELLSMIVRLQVAEYNEKKLEQPIFRYLTENQLRDTAEAAGKVGFGTRYNENDANPETAVAAALQAFEDGLFRVFAETIELEKLDSPLTLAPDENLTFIRLTMLAGRMW